MEKHLKHEQKCRALKMVRASLNNALATNTPSPSGGVELTEMQVNSALSCVNSVLKDSEDNNTALSPIDIAQLVLEVLQLILSHLPGSSRPALTEPAPSAEPKIDTSGILNIAEVIMQILELILSRLPQKGVPLTAPAVTEHADISSTDLAALILEVLQLLLNKFGKPSSVG